MVTYKYYLKPDGNSFLKLYKDTNIPVIEEVTLPNGETLKARKEYINSSILVILEDKYLVEREFKMPTISVASFNKLKDWLESLETDVITHKKQIMTIFKFETGHDLEYFKSAN